MSQSKEDQELYELLRHADQLINDQDPDDDLMAEFEDSMQTDPNAVYRNAANGYGAEQPQPAQAPADDGFSIRAYNADFRNTPQQGRLSSAAQETTVLPHAAARQEDAQYYSDEEPAIEKKKKKKHHRRRRGCLTTLVILAILVGSVAFGLRLFIAPPKNSMSRENRKRNTASILLCGTDVSGDRTDTMMLLYVDGNTNEAGLLTLPRDTYTQTAYGLEVKLNSAYGRNGGGEEGMEVLMDYVQKLTGYRPDGYVLIDLSFMEEIIDLMGGVDFDVPQEITFQDKGFGIDVSLSPGMQHLDGRTALGLLRFRFGYYNQDLGRQDVQKQFLKACMEQWFSASNLQKLPELLSHFREDSMSSLTTGNYLWFGFNLLQSGFTKISTDTLPGYATMIGDQSFYVLYPDEVAALLDARYNPFTRPITQSDLQICTEP